MTVGLADESNIFEWKVTIEGPAGSPYAVCVPPSIHLNLRIVFFSWQGHLKAPDALLVGSVGNLSLNSLPPLSISTTFWPSSSYFLTPAPGLPLRSEHHSPAKLPLQAAHRHLRDQGLPPQHLQRLASQQRDHVSGHAARDGVETKHQDLRRAGVCATAVERYVASQPTPPAAWRSA
jgi:hypothetical protein